MDFEALVLLCKAALEPVQFLRGIPEAEAWGSVLRAEDLLTYGSRLVRAAGGGDASAPNSFGTVVEPRSKADPVPKPQSAYNVVLGIRRMHKNRGYPPW